MNLRQSFVFIPALFYASTILADGTALSSQLHGADGWVGYHVAMVEDAGSVCCYSDIAGAGNGRTRCDLDSSNGSVISDGGSRASVSELSVYWHVEGGKPDQIRAFTADCPVSSQKPIRWIDPVAAEDSIAEISRWMQAGDVPDRKASSGMPALALHADEESTDALIRFVESSSSTKFAEDALFWLGHARGIPGADYVEKVATSDPSADLRQHATFALSQSHVDDAYLRVRRISRNDKTAEVRGQALFWMAQMKDSRAEADILDALNREDSRDAREQAVFALSQLGESVATPALIAVIRGDYPRPVKERALFWLGQAGTDEALAFLDAVLTK
jgi:hypothetical protein